MLTKELVLELWSKTYNTEVKSDWSHIDLSGGSMGKQPCRGANVDSEG